MLSQTTGYAISALGYLAGAGGKAMLIKEMAAASEVPLAYLAKIVNALARKGLVVTQRGIGGGVLLARPAAAITFYDLAQALDDPLLQRRCLLGTASCSDERACPAHAFWTRHREEGIDFLKGKTLQHSADFEARRRGRASEGDKHGL